MFGRRCHNGFSVMRKLLLTIVAVFVSFAGTPQVKGNVEAVHHALVVGVSGYDPKIMRPLQAPENDVRLIWDLLIESGFEQSQIQVLADRVAEGKTTPSQLAMPTRENIVAAFENLISDVAERKDEQHFVFIYMTGHGSRQPQITLSDDVEPDNFDEVFLPIDVGPIDFATRSIKNGLVDDDIRTLLQRLRDAGNVFVWVVFDACHAGDMTRGIEKDTQAKYIDPIALVPEQKRDQWRKSLAATKIMTEEDSARTGHSTDDGWLAKGSGDASNIAIFAAAEADKLALELRIAEADNKVFSAFTYHLVKAMRRSKNTSYRDLAHHIDREYAAFQEDLPSPVYEGELDRGVDLLGSVSATLRWPAQYDASSNTITSQLGTLSGVGEGSVLALHSSASPDAAPDGYLNVTDAGLNHSTAEAIAFQGQPEPRLEDLKGSLTISVAKRNVNLGLRVAVPPDDNNAPGKLATQAIRLIQAGNGESTRLKLDWVAADDQADVYLRARSNQLFIVPGSHSSDHVDASNQFAIELAGKPEKVAADLRENLWRLTRKKNLLRIAATVTPPKAPAPAEVSLYRISSPSLESKQADRYRCPAPDMTELNEGGELIDRSKPLKLKHCDVLRIEVSNNSEKRIQVTGLMVGSDASISVFDVGNRPIIKPQNLLQASSLIQIVTWCAPPDCKQLGLPEGEQIIGRERLLLLVFELPDGAAPANLSYLAQPSLSKAKIAATTATRSQKSELERLLGQAGLIPKTRSVSVGAINDATLEILQWDVVR